MGDPVGGWERRTACFYAVAVHAPATGPHEHGAERTDQPHAELTTFCHQTSPRVQRPRLVVEQVAEQAERYAVGVVLRRRFWDGFGRRARTALPLAKRPRDVCSAGGI